MAKQRIQVGPLADPVPLTPRAAPVDTFHRPDVVAPPEGPSQMAQLAEALGQFSPHLQALGIDLHREQAANENTAGAAKVLADSRLQNRQGFNDLIKSGEIPEAKSPYFLKGMQEQLGRIEGNRYDAALREAYTNAQAQHQPDISSFIGGFTSQYVQNHGLDGGAPEFQDVFTKAVSDSAANLQAQHVSRWETEQSALARQRVYQEVGFHLDSLLYDSPEKKAADIRGVVDSMVTNGLSGTDANKAVIDAITDKARDNKDASVLNMLDLINTGNGKLGNIQYAKDKRDAVETAIYSDKRQQDNAEWAQRERGKKVVIEDLKAQAATRIGQDPLADISDLTSQAEKVDPDGAKSMREYKDYVSTLSHKVYDDPKVLGDLYNHIYSGTASKGEIMDLVTQGKLSPDRIPYAFRDMEEAAKHADLLAEPTINRTIEETGSAISGGDFATDPVGKQRAQEAKNLLRRGVIEYQTTHPNAGRNEILSDVVKNSEAIKKGYGIAPAPIAPGVVNTVLGSSPTPAKPAATPAAAPTGDKSLYASTDALKAAIEEYNTSNGVGGRLAIQAEALGISVPDLIKSQSALLRKPAAKK